MTKQPAEPASQRQPRVPATAATAATAERPPEDELWRLASKADTSSAYENYLDKYPKGRHATDARLRLESKQPKIVMSVPQGAASANASEPAAESAAVTTSPKLRDSGIASSGTGASSASASGTDAASPSANEPSQDERELWKAATGINEPPAYESYLNLYPNGHYADIARERLARATSKGQAEQAGGTAQAAPQPPAAAKEAPTQIAAARPSSAPATSDRQERISPQEPAVPKIEDAPRQAPGPAMDAAKVQPKSEPEPGAATSSAGAKTLKLDDQTMIGNFAADPKTGIVSGTGKIIWKNGNQFEGTLVRGVKEGKGKFIWANGQRYSGDWARDMPNGKGTIVFANGNRYEGDVKDGVPHGQGINRFKGGDVYAGAWVGGKIHGQGRYTWPNGSYWVGEFRNDQRTANGKMVFADEAAGGTASGSSATATGENASGGGDSGTAAKAALER